MIALAVVVALTGASNVDAGAPKRVAVVAVDVPAATVASAQDALKAASGYALASPDDVAAAMKDAPACAPAGDDCWLKIALLNGFDVVLVVTARDDVTTVRAIAKGSDAVSRSGRDVGAVTLAVLRNEPPKAPSSGNTLAWSGAVMASLGALGAIASGVGVATLSGTIGDPNRAAADKLAAANAEPFAIGGVVVGAAVVVVGAGMLVASLRD